MTDDFELDLQTTYHAIRQAALARRFISYGQLAAANDVGWQSVRYAMPKHLDALVQIAAQRGWPMLTSIVVTQNDLDTGKLDGSSRGGFIAAAQKAGYQIVDPAEFVESQQRKVFEWAATAPDSLDFPASTASKSAKPKGPRFVQYFHPVLEALRAFGGEASPRDVYNWVRENVSVPEDELQGTHKKGQSKFENKVGWARFYLAKAALIDGKNHGRWTLTSAGKETDLDQAQALALFKDIQSRFKPGAEDDEQTAPEPIMPSALFNDQSRRFWFAGAGWSEGDQTERFIAEGIWQNGYDDKFSDSVAKMRPGDRIAIKAAFVQKYNLPFDNKGKNVSCMRIKAIGTILENVGDGKAVKVEWERVMPAREWYFYTYRVTLVEADPQNDLARRLILFTFADEPQDYEFWLKVPHFAKKYKPESVNTLEQFFTGPELEDEPEEILSPYDVGSILEDGCFLSRAELENALSRITLKKNLILQGPPGTGKTWLAKRLGYALIGTHDRSATRKRLRVVQFHPSLSYEDFVRGWRPSGNGNLALIDGVFLEVVQAAEAEPDMPFVLIIEEINRGNPAQIFGEMLTLLEDTKRHPEEALELAYRREEGERIFIPANLHIIGTMNIADRSLALVDLALRRRFAFLSLEPRFGNAWRNWCSQRGGITDEILSSIETRMAAVNQEITNDRTLGAQFAIGHSYVTPSQKIPDARRWFKDIVVSEIGPLLDEYWFDDKASADSAKKSLLVGFED